MVTLTFPTWMEPYRALATGKMTGDQWQALLRQLIWPVMGIAIFLLLWQLAAQRIDTSLGQFPGSDRNQPDHGDEWLPAGVIDCHSSGHRDRFEQYCLRGHESTDSAVQTGLAAGLAAAGDHGSERGVCDG